MAKSQSSRKKRGAPRQNPTKERLTATQARLMETLLDPANRLRPVEEVCRIAGVHKDTYYEAFKRPHFVKIYTERSKDLALRHAAQVMNSFAREAQRGSFQHGKVILEMAGVYTPKEKVEVTGKDGGPLDVRTQYLPLSPTEARELAIKQGLIPADEHKP